MPSFATSKPVKHVLLVDSAEQKLTGVAEWHLGPAACPSAAGSSSRSLPVIPLASIGSRLWGGSRHDDLLRTFNRIDVDRKGHITEEDLRLFAEKHNLPRSYVGPFMVAIRQQQQQISSSGSSGNDGLLTDDLQQDDDNSSSSSKGAADEVGFEAFRQFVVEREQGLREAFQLFDTDGDGSISYEDLDLSLSRVAICCPTSRCVMRTRHQVVAELLGRLNIQEGRRLDFNEFRQFFMLLPEREQLVEYWLSGPAALACADMGCHFSILERSARRGSPWGHLLAGAVAGAASRSATAPLETLRLAAMAGTLPPGSSLISAGRQLLDQGDPGGIRALFRGNAVNVLRSAPARAVDFFAFDLFKSWLGSESYSKTFAAAGLAGTFSWMLLYPLEVVRSRVTLDTLGRYKGLVHCLHTMAAQEGPAAFYRGLGPSVAAIAPEAAITYGLHDLLKRGYKQTYNREPGIAASLWCGVFASWSGQLVAFPLETVSRRMQLAGAAAVPPAAAAAAGSAAGNAAVSLAPPAGAATAAAAAAGGSSSGSGSMAQVLNSILKEGGPAALYRGIGAATLRLVPSAIISFGMYEMMRKLITDLEVQQEEALARAQHQQLHRVLSRAEQCNQLIQQVQQQGPAAALITAQQCQACSPEALLQAAAGQQQEGPQQPSTSSSSLAAVGSSSGCAAAGGLTVCGCPAATQGVQTLLSPSNIACTMPVQPLVVECDSSSSNSSSGASGSSNSMSSSSSCGGPSTVSCGGASSSVQQSRVCGSQAAVAAAGSTAHSTPAAAAAAVKACSLPAGLAGGPANDPIVPGNNAT